MAGSFFESSVPGEAMALGMDGGGDYIDAIPVHAAAAAASEMQRGREVFIGIGPRHWGSARTYVRGFLAWEYIYRQQG